MILGGINMQYDAEVFPYRRITKDNNIKKESKQLDIVFIGKVMFYVISSFLMSRVLLINGMAPFGIAFLGAISMRKEEKILITTGAGALLGYITIYNSIESLGGYIVIVATFVVLNSIFRTTNENKKGIIMIISALLEMFCYKWFAQGLSITVAFLTAFFEIGCIIPLYYIIDYSIICFENIKTKHLFENEELITMAIVVSLAISGTWGFSFYGISLRNILALTFVMGVAFVSGSAIASAAGVAVGAIVGMNSNSMIAYISMFGLCGLVSGIFKETGRLVSSISFIISFSIVKIYSNTLDQFKLIEGLISTLAFFLIPTKAYLNLSLELNKDKKLQHLNDGYIDKVKNIFIERLDKFSDVLNNMSIILSNLADNDKLVMKNKSAALVENLAASVCANCNMKAICWKRENYYTYEAFYELIQNYQEKKGILPKELERKCTKRTALLRNTEDIVNNYIINEMWRSRLSEGRELLSGQINNMAGSVKEIIDEFNTHIKIDNNLETQLIRKFDKEGIQINHVLCFIDKNNRTNIKLTLKACGGSQFCIKKILPILNEESNKCMCVSDDGCSIDPNTNLCTVTFEEAHKYHIASYVSRKCKEGEKYNGDSYTFSKLKDGTYMTIISDGMGSGPRAGQESQAIVDLIEKFTSSGFSKDTAINTVNSIMTMKFAEDEKFSTVDLSSVDLYTGEAYFMKVGAVASFIKSGNKVITINSKSLPMGVLDKVDIDVNKKQVKSGDIIVMLSDGIIDYNNENAGRVDWLVDFLESNNSTNPEELSSEILIKAQELGENRVKDDMTVIVSKVYGLY